MGLFGVGLGSDRDGLTPAAGAPPAAPRPPRPQLQAGEQVELFVRVHDCDREEYADAVVVRAPDRSYGEAVLRRMDTGEEVTAVEGTFPGQYARLL